jgi:low molecular weight protein-tyrosine phosphatase
MTEVLVLCTANQCRSPMAAALLARELTARGRADVRVASAGVAAVPGLLPPPEVVAVLAGYGVDVAGHCSAPVTAAGLDRADLVLAVAREHLRYAVVTEPGAWPRAFTARELARRAVLGGRREPGQPLAVWLAGLHAGRRRLDLLGDSADDDVADPAGGPLHGYQLAAAQLHRIAAVLADLGWGTTAEADG